MTDYTAKLKDILDLSKQYGVKKIKIGVEFTDVLEIEFSDKIVIERKDLGPLVGKTEGNPTEDELLFWSTQEEVNTKTEAPIEQ